MTRDELWDAVAPDGYAFSCPDCKHWASLGGNAAYHRSQTDHGDPVLVPLKLESQADERARLKREQEAGERQRQIELLENLLAEMDQEYAAIPNGWDEKQEGYVEAYCVVKAKLVDLRKEAR